MSKKILFFSGGSYVSGMEIVTLHLMRGLKENGYEVRCIFSGWNDGNFKKRLDEAGIPNYGIKIGWIYLRKPLWTLDTLIHYPTAFFTCRKILKEFKPDICQFGNFSMPVMLYPIISSNAVYNLQESYNGSVKEKTIFKLLNKKVRYFTAVSKHIANVLSMLEIPGDKIKLIYNGIPAVEATLNNSAVPKDTGSICFGIIGQVVFWKGHKILVEAVEKLIHSGVNNFKVLIFGNDNTDFGSELKEHIKKKELSGYFIWKGFVNDQNKVYEECDVVVVPSLSGEPCSLTIIESMARGKALIVSDRGGNPELIQDHYDGLVFNNADPNQLFDCMVYFMNNKSKIADFGGKAKVKADIHYNYLNMTESYIDLYKNLV